MSFRLGFPIDTGYLGTPSIVLVRASRAKYHWCREGGCSELRYHSGAKFVFEHAPSEIQDQFRFEFEPLPTPPNKRYNKPDQICDVGYSDSAACTLAIAQYQPALESTEQKTVLISCSFSPNHYPNQGFSGLLLDKVTNEDEKISRDSLKTKWDAAQEFGVLALVLHEEDAKLLVGDPSFSAEILELQEGTFTQLLKNPREKTPIVYCRSNELPLLAKALLIDSPLFSNHPLNLSQNNLFFYPLGVSLAFCFVLMLFTYLFGNSYFSWFSNAESASLGGGNFVSSSQNNKNNIGVLVQKLKSDKVSDTDSLTSDLITLLKEGDSKTRAYAALILGAIGPDASEAIPALIEGTHDPDEEVRKKVIWALGKFGPQSITSKIDSLKDEESDRSNSLISGLIELLKQEDSKARMHAAWILGTLEPKTSQAIPYLVEAIKDSDEEVRKKVIWALGKYGPLSESAIPPLIETLKKEIENQNKTTKEKPEKLQNQQILKVLIWSFGKIGLSSKSAIPFLKQVLKNKSPTIRTYTVEALAQIDLETTPLLIETLKDPSWQVRMEVTWQLGQMGPKAKDAIPALIEILQDQDKNVRRGAAWALGMMGAKANAAVPILFETLKKDKDFYVRKAAADALKEIIDKEINQK